MRPAMNIIGLIGKIGSGKSAVASILSEFGALVVDADAIAHAALDLPDVRSRLVEYFGTSIVSNDGRINRHMLATIVFGPTEKHTQARIALESIVHPEVFKQIQTQIAHVPSHTTIVLDIPLLLQAGYAKQCSHLIEVLCDEAVRKRRLDLRGLSRSQQSAREAAWIAPRTDHALSLREFSAQRETTNCVSTIDTSGLLENTRNLLASFWKELLADPRSDR